MLSHNVKAGSDDCDEEDHNVFNGNGTHVHNHESVIPRVRLLFAVDVARVERQVF